DLTGRLSLSDGPAGSRAGPFPVSEGITLPMSGTGSVTVKLPADVPNGPWVATVELASGRVRHTAKATITLPHPGGEPRTAHSVMEKAFPLIVPFLAGVAVVALGLLGFRAYRRRRDKVSV